MSSVILALLPMASRKRKSEAEPLEEEKKEAFDEFGLCLQECARFGKDGFDRANTKPIDESKWNSVAVACKTMMQFTDKFRGDELWTTLLLSFLAREELTVDSTRWACVRACLPPNEVFDDEKRKSTLELMWGRNSHGAINYVYHLFSANQSSEASMRRCRLVIVMEWALRTGGCLTEAQVYAYYLSRTQPVILSAADIIDRRTKERIERCSLAKAWPKKLPSMEAHQAAILESLQAGLEITDKEGGTWTILRPGWFAGANNVMRRGVFMQSTKGEEAIMEMEPHICKDLHIKLKYSMNLTSGLVCGIQLCRCFATEFTANKSNSCILGRMQQQIEARKVALQVVDEVLGFDLTGLVADYLCEGSAKQRQAERKRSLVQ